MAARNRWPEKRRRRLERATRKHQTAKSMPFGGVLYPGEKLNPYPLGSLEAWVFTLAVLSGGITL